MSNILSDLGKEVKIQGKNFDVNGKLCLASQFYEGMDPKPSAENIELMREMEKRWFKACEKAKLSKITQLKIVDGKVVIPEGTPYHNFAHPTPETVKSISKYGVLCSENFGCLESENEGRFCSFAIKTTSKKLALQNNRASGINFYFDSTNPILQSLLRLDYFEYEGKKKKGESLDYIPESAREFLDKIIEPLSPSGTHMRDNERIVWYAWLAIPFGFPPELINGIEIYSTVKMDTSLDEISNMFPKAVIFDENKNVLMPSLQSQNTMDT